MKFPILSDFGAKLAYYSLSCMVKEPEYNSYPKPRVQYISSRQRKGRILARSISCPTEPNIHSVQRDPTYPKPKIGWVLNFGCFFHAHVYFQSSTAWPED